MEARRAHDPVGGLGVRGEAVKRTWFWLVLWLLPSNAAWALPRFAARNAMECIQCHINPSGGGMRNDYGAAVFEKTWLPLASNPEDWVSIGAADSEGEEEDADVDPPFSSAFSGRITEWLALGGDIRTAYIYVRPDDPPAEGEDRNVTSSFFLMQADLYHAAQLNSYVTVVLDVGVYSGFEVWGLFSLFQRPGLLDLKLKVGRFVPPFGIREVEHQLFTREGVGLGATDRDTGVELSVYLGPWTTQVALVNGTLGETAFDSTGSERGTFEKGVAVRSAVRLELSKLRLQLGGSFYFNENANQTNPVFTGVLPLAQSALVSEGLDEVRGGVFLTANLGRFTYLGDLVAVRDAFYAEGLGRLRGHALYQELSFVPLQGLELVATHEFMDPDYDLGNNAVHRLGAVVELFPLPFTEVRLMGRRQWSLRPEVSAVNDLVLFLHLFL